MNCRKVQSLISAYVDCELSGMDMLAIRHHLSNCSYCSEEFECTLTIKRAYGSLTPEQPSEQFLASIYQRLHEVSTPRHLRFIASVRKHFEIPDRRAFASLSIGLVAMLVILRSGDVNVNGYTNTALSPVAQNSSYIDNAPSSPFLANSRQTEEFQAITIQKSESQPWPLFEKHSAVANSANSARFSLASFSLPMQ